MQGSFTSFNGTALTGSAALVRRLNADGTLDQSYSIPFNSFYAAQPDSSFYGPGATATNTQFVLLYALASGANDGSFLNTPFGGGVVGYTVFYGTAVQTDGRILVFGKFAMYGGSARNGIARLNADGSLDTSFTPPSSTSARIVERVTIQASGKLVITYEEGTSNSIVGYKLARLNANGTSDNTFAVGSGPSVGASTTPQPSFYILTQPDGKLLLNGNFTSFNG